MGTIVARKRKNGSIGYNAQLLIKRGGAILHRETRTFARRQAASAWLERRETELSKPGGLERAKGENTTLAAVIDRYVDESLKAIGRTKAQVLKAIKGYDIADMRCSQITSADVVTLARTLSAKVQ